MSENLRTSNNESEVKRTEGNSESDGLARLEWECEHLRQDLERVAGRPLTRAEITNLAELIANSIRPGNYNLNLSK